MVLKTKWKGRKRVFIFGLDLDSHPHIRMCCIYAGIIYRTRLGEIETVLSLFLFSINWSFQFPSDSPKHNPNLLFLLKGVSEKTGFLVYFLLFYNGIVMFMVNFIYFLNMNQVPKEETHVKYNNHCE